MSVFRIPDKERVKMDKSFRGEYWSCKHVDLNWEKKLWMHDTPAGNVLRPGIEIQYQYGLDLEEPTQLLAHVIAQGNGSFHCSQEIEDLENDHIPILAMNEMPQLQCDRNRECVSVAEKLYVGNDFPVKFLCQRRK